MYKAPLSAIPWLPINELNITKISALLLVIYTTRTKLFTPDEPLVPIIDNLALSISTLNCSITILNCCITITLFSTFCCHSAKDI